MEAPLYFVIVLLSSVGYFYAPSFAYVFAVILQLLLFAALALFAHYLVMTVPSKRGVHPAFPEIIEAVNETAKRRNAWRMDARAQWVEFAKKALPPNVRELIATLVIFVIIASYAKFAFLLPMRLVGVGVTDVPPLFIWILYALLVGLAIMSIYEAGTVGHVRRHIAHRRQQQAAVIREQEEKRTRKVTAAAEKQAQLEAAAAELEKAKATAASSAAVAKEAQLQAAADAAKLTTMVQHEQRPALKNRAKQMEENLQKMVTLQISQDRVLAEYLQADFVLQRDQLAASDTIAKDKLILMGILASKTKRPTKTFWEQFLAALAHLDKMPPTAIVISVRQDFQRVLNEADKWAKPTMQLLSTAADGVISRADGTNANANFQQPPFQSKTLEYRDPNTAVRMVFKKIVSFFQNIFFCLVTNEFTCCSFQ